MTFLRGVFSEPNGSPSASRVMMAFHAVIGSAILVHVGFHNHAMPGAVETAAVTGFVTAPYAINQLKNTFNQNPPPPPDPAPAAPDPAGGQR